jgi:excisionase family DNA binding protein
MRTTIFPKAAQSDEYLTIAEAAALLKVSKSTVRRWIEAGTLPAYRVGSRGVRLKRAEMEQVVIPLMRERRQGERVAQAEQIQIRPLTPQERERGLQALEALRQMRQEILAERGGALFSDSAVLIREEREKRTQELMRSVEGS